MNWKEYRRWRCKENELNKQIYSMAKELQGPEKVANEYGPGYRTLKNYERPDIDDCLEQARHHYAQELESLKENEPSQTQREELEFELREHERSFSQRLHKAQEEKDLTQRLGQLKELSKELSDEMWEEAEVYAQEEGISIPRAFERIYGTNLFSLRATDMQVRTYIEETKDRLEKGIYHQGDPWRQPFTLEPSKEVDRRAQQLVRQYQMDYESAVEKVMQDDPILKDAYIRGKMGYGE